MLPFFSKKLGQNELVKWMSNKGFSTFAYVYTSTTYNIEYMLWQLTKFPLDNRLSNLPSAVQYKFD